MVYSTNGGDLTLNAVILFTVTPRALYVLHLIQEDLKVCIFHFSSFISSISVLLDVCAAVYIFTFKQ